MRADFTPIDWHEIKFSLPSTPAFVIDEATVRQNLQKLADLRALTGCKVLYSVKALTLEYLLDLCLEYVDGFSVSSLFEAKFAKDCSSNSGTIHLTTPGIRSDELEELAQTCTHISFNSLNQFSHYANDINGLTSTGLRLNPRLSYLSDDRFNPCRAASKLGASMEALSQITWPENLQGLHIHSMFAGTDFTPLKAVSSKLLQVLNPNLQKLKWLNLGGGYLYDEIDNIQAFAELIQVLKQSFQGEVYIEPGKAVAGKAGYLVTSVIDCFQSDGKSIAVLDTSVNHNPEVFEYQWQPELIEHEPAAECAVLLAGSTCLAGDLLGEFRFAKPLSIGDRLVFRDVGAYSLVKASRFNGLNLPSIYKYADTRLTRIKQYDYTDFKILWSNQRA